MNQAVASLELDQRAMALLSRLLDTTESERDRELAALRETDPELQARVQRLLLASDASTRPLAERLAGGLTAGPPQEHGGMLIAGYRLLSPLGQGGMSSVWLAERADGQLKRQVAIKLPLATHLSAVLAERFARERDVLAALDHPHIARLIDAGVASVGGMPQPFIVLEHVDGVPITEHAKGLDTRAKLQLFLQVLSAIEHAHRHLTVHRDLKPSNILVDRQGQVKLLDFGIAKLLAEPPGACALTQDVASVLTPRYAAPEQVLGHSISTATDVYSAGVVLYELLTERQPYGRPQDNAAQLMQHVAHTEARSPGLALDIDTVLLKALQKSPVDRYASIERLAEDLRRLLADEPILARRVPWWQRLRLLLRRHRLVTAGGAAAALLLLLAAGLLWQQQRETGAQKARADAVRDFVFTMVSDAEPEQGKSEVSGLDMMDAAVARAGREFAGDPLLHGELLAELGRVYFRLQQPDKSIATLREALRLLQSHAQSDDPALNRTRAVLAQSLVTRDNAQAAALAEQAVAGCTRRGAACAEARARAQYAHSILASWAGRYPDALVHARAMLAESERAFGANHLNLQPALETLASSARSSGELQEAAQTVQRAQALAAGSVMKASYRQRLDLLQAVIEVDLGRYAAATQRLTALLSGAGSDSERSIQWRWLAAAQTGLGRPDAALRAAQQARQLGPSNTIGWLARQAWGDAASRAGQHEAGLAALQSAQAGLLSVGTQSTSAALLRLRRQLAEAQLRQGRTAQAIEALQTLLQDHAAAPLPHRSEWALALDTLACARTHEGRREQALGLLGQASTLHAQVLPAEHPLRLRNAALASLSAGDPLSNAQTALTGWLAGLASDSPLRSAQPIDCRALL